MCMQVIGVAMQGSATAACDAHGAACLVACEGDMGLMARRAGGTA